MSEHRVTYMSHKINCMLQGNARHNINDAKQNQIIGPARSLPRAAGSRLVWISIVICIWLETKPGLSTTCWCEFDAVSVSCVTWMNITIRWETGIDNISYNHNCAAYE